MTEVVAAVDCGTNTIRLLVGDLPRVLARESRIVRLGEGVDATGRLTEAALARAFAALDAYAEVIRAHGATRIRCCATSATRDAENSEDFRAGVRARLGVEPEVLTGEEEAQLSFAGAVRGLRFDLPRPLLVVDVGGGSTELVLGGVTPLVAASLDVGAVRLHERHVRSDPPTAAELAAVTADVDAVLDECPVDPAVAAAVVGVAGTVGTVVAGALDLPAYDPSRIDQAVVPVADIRACTERLVAMTVAERRALPYMAAGRADVIDAGALILTRVLARCRVGHLVASESDLLDGIAWSLVG